MKKLVFALFMVSALVACGKKKGSSSAAAAPAGAAGVPGQACQLNAQGQCVGNVNMNPVYVGRNIWTGNVGILQPQLYIQFLMQNGLCNGIQCQAATGGINFFELTVQTLRDTLPGAVRFWITPNFNGIEGRPFSKRVQGYGNISNNGFQLAYNQMVNNCPPGAMCIQGQPQYQQQYDQSGRPMILPYGAPNQQGLIAPQAQSLQIVLTYPMQQQPQGQPYYYGIQQPAQVSVYFNGTEIGRGQVTPRYSQQYYGVPQNTQNAPQVAPYVGPQRY